MLSVRRFFGLLALVCACPALAQQQPNWAAAPGTPLSAWALQPTQADPRDPPRSVRVGRGQSLYDIATLYQIPVLALIEANGLQPPYAVAPGAVLLLPAPNVHVVGEGERFEDIARAYNIDLHSLATLNRMRPPYLVRPGDRMVLPAGARSDDEEQAPLAPTSASAEPPVQTETVHAGARFAWPIRGPIVARYGMQASGARLDGIEIAGREGDPIAVAADGEVVYAGSDLAAYGTLVLVRHADNYVTAYGFARRALVREGQHVRAGQAIAELGSRPEGRARLLFQVRQGAHAVDPAPLLGIAPD
jgi:murein DD-endopeptidase MepM/ murein hydrolase activator NlpD